VQYIQTRFVLQVRSDVSQNVQNLSFIFTADGLMDFIVWNFLSSNALKMAELQQINRTADALIGFTLSCCKGIDKSWVAVSTFHDPIRLDICIGKMYWWLVVVTRQNSLLPFLWIHNTVFPGCSLNHRGTADIPSDPLRFKAGCSEGLYDSAWHWGNSLGHIIAS